MLIPISINSASSPPPPYSSLISSHTLSFDPSLQPLLAQPLRHSRSSPISPLLPRRTVFFVLVLLFCCDFFFFFLALSSLIRSIALSHFALFQLPKLRQPKPFPLLSRLFFIPAHHNHNHNHSTCASFQCLLLKVTIQRHVHAPVQLTTTRGASITASCVSVCVSVCRCVSVCVCVQKRGQMENENREEHIISDCHVCKKMRPLVHFHDVTRSSRPTRTRTTFFAPV